MLAKIAAHITRGLPSNGASSAEFASKKTANSDRTGRLFTVSARSCRRQGVHHGRSPYMNMLMVRLFVMMPSRCGTDSVNEV